MIDVIIVIILVALASWMIRYFDVPGPIDKVLYAALVVVVVFVLIRVLTGGGPLLRLG